MSLKMQSSSAYSTLKDSGFVVMPSERTLSDYIHFYEARSGFHSDWNDHLSARSNVVNLTEVQKCVALSFDEMRVREDLVYHKNSGKVIGFVNLGNVDDCLNLLQRGNGELPERLPLATHILVFMIRGIVTTVFPVRSFSHNRGHFSMPVRPRLGSCPKH